MIRVKNWAKYQSYKDRKPPWIRFHRSILDDYKYQTMGADARALLPMLWLLACEDEDPKSGSIQSSVDEISFRLRIERKVVEKTLVEIQCAGFIECIESVTKPYQECTQTVPPETETETETEEDTSTVVADAVTKVTACPHGKIISLYNEYLPTLPQVDIKLWKGSQRQKDLAQRWKEDRTRDLVWWGRFFERVSKSDFLTGRKKEWRADLGWLLKRANFAKVIEGKYDNVGGSVTLSSQSCDICGYNVGRKCGNLKKPGFDRSRCTAFSPAGGKS